MRNARVLLLIAALGCLGCGPNRIDVLLECPSPDRSLLAIVSWQGGGGGPGWTKYLVTLQPATSQAAGATSSIGLRAETILKADDVQRVGLKWMARDRLTVAVAYHELASVSRLFHRYPMIGNAMVHVRFEEIEPDANSSTKTRFSCESGDLRLDDPPSRRVR